MPPRKPTGQLRYENLRLVSIYMYVPQLRFNSKYFISTQMDFDRFLGRLIFRHSEDSEFKKWNFRIWRIYDNGDHEIVKDKLIEDITLERPLAFRYKHLGTATVAPVKIMKADFAKLREIAFEMSVDKDKRERRGIGRKV